MATLPVQVRPGDVISSELLNAMLAELAALKGSGSIGTQTVPNVFGLMLADARTRLANPALQFTLGFTLDVNGAAVDASSTANGSRIVLNQSPAADARVAVNTLVNLVVSAAATSGGTTPTPTASPRIVRLLTASGIEATSFSVNTTMIIDGSGFSRVDAENTVKLGTNVVTATSDPTDKTFRLRLVVPDLPGVREAGPAGLPVVVAITRSGNPTAATKTVTVTPQSASQVTIEKVEPDTQDEGELIVITGTNFSPAATVSIRRVSAEITQQTSTTITARVPEFSDVGNNTTVPAPIVVKNPGVGSEYEAAFPAFFVTSF